MKDSERRSAPRPKGVNRYYFPRGSNHPYGMPTGVDRFGGLTGFAGDSEIPNIFDPNGSYTGVPFDELEKPVQDADDL